VIVFAVASTWVTRHGSEIHPEIAAAIAAENVATPIGARGPARAALVGAGDA
jgi:hypothetical protein